MPDVVRNCKTPEELKKIFANFKVHSITVVTDVGTEISGDCYGFLISQQTVKVAGEEIELRTVKEFRVHI
jgi:hypothetical protein